MSGAKEDYIFSNNLNAFQGRAKKNVQMSEKQN